MTDVVTANFFCNARLFLTHSSVTPCSRAISSNLEEEFFISAMLIPKGKYLLPLKRKNPRLPLVSGEVILFSIANY